MEHPDMYPKPNNELCLWHIPKRNYIYIYIYVCQIYDWNPNSVKCQTLINYQLHLSPLVFQQKNIPPSVLLVATGEGAVHRLAEASRHFGPKGFPPGDPLQHSPPGTQPGTWATKISIHDSPREAISISISDAVPLIFWLFFTAHFRICLAKPGKLVQ